jgi:hypothetical protein
MDEENPSTIYTVDVMENGMFKDSGKFAVTTGNKREYWNGTLIQEVSISRDYIFRPSLTHLPASAWSSRPRSFR